MEILTITNEIEKIDLNNRTTFLFSYYSIIQTIADILKSDLTETVPDYDPYFIYIREELNDCNQLLSVYKFDNLYPTDKNRDENLLKEFNERLSNYFINSFPYTDKVNKEIIEMFEYTNFCEYFNFLLDGLQDGWDLVGEYMDISNLENNLRRHKYTLKRYETDCEIEFYKTILKYLSKDYHLIAQVCLSSIIDKKCLNGSLPKHVGELQYVIDFGIFDNEYNIKMLIEINDHSHNFPDRKLRDKKVNAILNNVGIPLITFTPKDRFNEELLIAKLNKFVKPKFNN